MDFFNKRKQCLVQKMIKNFNQEKDGEVQKIIDLVKKTDFTLKIRHSIRFMSLKNEVENDGFIFIGENDGYGSKESIKKKILKIQEILKEE